MIFKRKIAKTEIVPVTITQLVNEFCDRFAKTHYISIDVSNEGDVHLFLGGEIDKKDEDNDNENM